MLIINTEYQYACKALSFPEIHKEHLTVDYNAFNKIFTKTWFKLCARVRVIRNSSI